ncbi:MAG: hypothetical protein WDZ76_07145 [Pseudohongiellaceae bacterium]
MLPHVLSFYRRCKSIPERSVVVFLSACLLSSCGGDNEDGEPVEWIDVPLSEHTFFDSQRQYLEDDYDILVLRESALEFKLGLDEGDSIIYHWTVDMAQPELLTSEFHGHTHRIGEEPGTVMFYKIHNDGAEAGTLVAPFDGIHGWYLNNESSEDITVKLHVSGFYEEID